jgi:hypothetical protein
MAGRDLTHRATIYYGGGPMTSSVIEAALTTFDCNIVHVWA